MRFLTILTEVASWIAGTLFISGITSVVSTGFTASSLVALWVGFVAAVLYFMLREFVDSLESDKETEIEVKRQNKRGARHPLLESVEESLDEIAFGAYRIFSLFQGATLTSFL